MPSSLILKKYRTSETLELTFENIENLSVKELKESASSELSISQDELKLVYGGRVLKGDKTLGEYRIVSGCTIFVMATKTKRCAKEQEPRGRSRRGLMENRRVLTLISRFLGNPTLLQDMTQGIEMVSGSSPMLQLLRNQQIVARLSDPDNIREYIQDHPEIGSMMEHVIRQFLGANIEGSLEDQDQEQLVDLLESHLEDEIAQVEEEGEAQRAQAQEQMFEHSQALHAHSQQQEQQQQGHRPSSSSSAGQPVTQDAAYNPLTSLQHGTIASLPPSQAPRGPITQDQLVSALASAMSSSGSPRLSSSPRRNASPQSSQHQFQRSSSDHASAPPPPYSAVVQPYGSATGSQQRGAGGGAATTTPAPINAATLQQALASVVGEGDRRQGQSTGSRSADRTRFYAQLEQLHLMGIHDETACLHALAATDGDLQAALEILYSQ